jgi:ribonucleoside-diphosphate reductase alpha chain
MVVKGGGALPRAEAEAEQMFVREQVREEGTEVSFESSFADLRAQVIQAAGTPAMAPNPVVAAMNALESRFVADAARAADKAGAVRDAYARRAAEARLKGYEGDACGNCGNFTLVRGGTCLKCDTCGSTSGCS